MRKIFLAAAILLAGGCVATGQKLGDTSMLGPGAIIGQQGGLGPASIGGGGGVLGPTALGAPGSANPNVPPGLDGEWAGTLKTPSGKLWSRTVAISGSSASIVGESGGMRCAYSAALTDNNPAKGIVGGHAVGGGPGCQSGFIFAAMAQRNGRLATLDRYPDGGEGLGELSRR